MPRVTTTVAAMKNQSELHQRAGAGAAWGPPAGGAGGEGAAAGLGAAWLMASVQWETG